MTKNGLKLSDAQIIEPQAEPCLTRPKLTYFCRSCAAPWPATRPLAKQALSR